VDDFDIWGNQVAWGEVPDFKDPHSSPSPACSK
jgi:hypothetical protein